MIQFFITGASSGIGKALAEYCLEQGHAVTGISRRKSISHENYQHVQLDLSDVNAVTEFQFPDVSGEKVVLVNNAGTIGEIGHIGNSKLTKQALISTMNINTSALMVLSHQFVMQFSDLNFFILNISSGAANADLDGWAAYCASKAAVDRFTYVVQNEIEQKKLKGRMQAVYPGTVDTEMQGVIREANPELGFSNQQRFIDLKQNQELRDAQWLAKQLWNIIDQNEQYPETVFRI